MRRLTGMAALLATVVAGPLLAAENLDVTAVLSPQEQMRFELGDGSPHFVLAVRREGMAEGAGMLAGGKVTEFGWHDIDPPHGGDPQGYLRIETGEGDLAIIRWVVRAVFVKGDAQPRLIDYGHWELVSGTGAFEGMRGVGTLTIKPAGGPDREFALVGEIAPAP